MEEKKEYEYIDNGWAIVTSDIGERYLEWQGRLPESPREAFNITMQKWQLMRKLAAAAKALADVPSDGGRHSCGLCMYCHNCTYCPIGNGCTGTPYYDVVNARDITELRCAIDEEIEFLREIGL